MATIPITAPATTVSGATGGKLIEGRMFVFGNLYNEVTQELNVTCDTSLK